MTDEAEVARISPEMAAVYARIRRLETRLAKVEKMGAAWPTAATACVFLLVVGWVLVEVFS